MIKLLFFGQLKESLQCEQLQLGVDKPITIAQLKALLVETYPSWEKHVFDKQLLTAVNQSMCNSLQLVCAGDEVALFPPVTGG